MSGALNTGKGRCQGTARLLIKPIRAVIELGALQDVLGATLSCVHHANRTGDIEDFIAVGLPQMHRGRDAMRAGHEIELIGSESSLGRLESMEGLKTLRRRGMILDLEIGEAWVESGSTGAAYVRDQGAVKRTPGWIRRNAARAERRGRVPKRDEKSIRPLENDTLALLYGKAVIHVREIVGPISEGPILVSTYGFSSIVAPAVLPVIPDSAREAFDAA